MQTNYFLSIETATATCSVTLSKDKKIIAKQESFDDFQHSKYLSVFIESLFRESGIEKNELRCIILSIGPGSYTGLRIGASVAKGLAYALDVPIVSVNTLQSMANGMLQEIQKNSLPATDFLLRPMIDARRMEVYSMLFDDKLNILENTQAIILDQNYFEQYDKPLWVAGDKIEKIEKLAKNFSKIKILKDFRLSSTHLIDLGVEKYKQQLFEDIAYFTPYYVKEFMAGIPKVKGLH
jgi:tRNA threonylcarbamoyladenosine biosynthesis protein TsaB